MNKNEFVKWLFNPFYRVAGWQSLLIGLVIMIITSVICFYSGVVLDGVLDIHLSSESQITWGMVFAYPFISHILFIVCACLLAMIFTRNFRLIDLAGTLTMARMPLLIGAIGGFGVSSFNVDAIMTNPMSVFQDAGFIIMLLLSVISGIWMLVLSYNAIKVSCDLKSGKLLLVLILGIFAAEVFAKISFLLLEKL